MALGVLVFVSWLHKQPTASGRRNDGIVQVRIAMAQQQSSPASAPVQPVSPALPQRQATQVRAVNSLSGVSLMADPGDTGAAASGEDEARYEDILFNHIAKYLRYPRKAGFVCPAGTTLLRFRTSRQGSIDSIVIEQSSGCSILDNAAVEALRRAQPLPPIPSILPERITVLMPLSFGRV